MTTMENDTSLPINDQPISPLMERIKQSDDLKRVIGIGTVLHFDEIKYNYLIRAWNKYLTPDIERLAAVFQGLKIGRFDHDKLSLLVYNYQRFQNEFVDKLIEEVNENPIDFVSRLFDADQVAAFADKKLAPLKAAIDLIIKDMTAPAYVDISFDFSQCHIVDGSVVINEPMIRDLCSVKIETDEQLEVWNSWLDVVAKYNQSIDLLVSKGYDPSSWPIFGDRGFIIEDKSGKISLHHDCINQIQLQKTFNSQLQVMQSRIQADTDHNAKIKEEIQITGEDGKPVRVHKGQDIDYGLQTNKVISY